ncbi:MAG: hypothetical protein Q4B28_02195 [bacterium]|nr:hypothetical protein [bacterium]
MQPLFPASCQKIQHQLIPGNKHQWTILAHFALNALDKAPEIAYYLGNFEHLEVSQDYFFLLQAVGQQAIECKNCSWVATGAEQVSVLQRFAFEPKIHQQHSAVLTGLPTSGKSFLSQGNRIKVMTVLKSGKINQYELFDIDERFALQAKRILMRNSQLWGLWRFVHPRLFVTNETQEVMGFNLDTSTSDSGIRLASAQVLLYGPALAKSMIQLEQKGSEIVIALLEIGNEKHHLQSYLLPQHRLIGKGIWDEERQILSFLTSYQGNSLIYGFEIKADGIRPLFARNYKKI